MSTALYWTLLALPSTLQVFSSLTRLFAYIWLPCAWQAVRVDLVTSQITAACTHVTQAYESVAILEGTSSLAQQALQRGTKLKLEDTHNLNAYFNKVTVCLFSMLYDGRHLTIEARALPHFGSCFSPRLIVSTSK